jgi:hypothetical protein
MYKLILPDRDPMEFPCFAYALAVWIQTGMVGEIHEQLNGGEWNEFTTRYLRCMSLFVPASEAA